MKMQDINELLNSKKCAEIDPSRLDKKRKPEKEICLKCNKNSIDWFWLESETPDIFPSHWVRLTCRCSILDYLREKRSFYIYKLEGQTERQIKESKNKVLLINNAIKAIEGCANNDEYYQKRFGLTDDLSFLQDYGEILWQLLFDCKSKEETEFYLELIRLEQ